MESVIVPDFTLVEFKEIIESLLNFSNISDVDGNNDFDYNNNSVDCEMDSPEHLISSLTRLTSRLQDNNLPEDDIVVVLLELAELEVTIPALLETGAGVVVRRLEKKSQGMVAKLTRELVIKWKGNALKYEPDVEEDDNNKNDPPFDDIEVREEIVEPAAIMVIIQLQLLAHSSMLKPKQFLLLYSPQQSRLHTQQVHTSAKTPTTISSKTQITTQSPSNMSTLPYQIYRQNLYH